MGMAGTDARMRVASVIWPSFKGTFKSDRINTRLPAKASDLASSDNVLTVDMFFYRKENKKGGLHRTHQACIAEQPAPDLFFRESPLTLPTSGPRWYRACGSRTPTRCHTSTQPYPTNTTL